MNFIPKYFWIDFTKPFPWDVRLIAPAWSCQLLTVTFIHATLLCCRNSSLKWSLALPSSPQEKLSAGNWHLHPFPYLIYSGSVGNSRACLCLESQPDDRTYGRPEPWRSWSFPPLVKPTSLSLKDTFELTLSKENAPTGNEYLEILLTRLQFFF